jgi:TolB-like protein/Tfp pilus assembly protein PilF
VCVAAAPSGNSIGPPGSPAYAAAREAYDSRKQNEEAAVVQEDESQPRGLFSELKRRNVLRAGALYLAAAWLIAQVVTSILPIFDVPTSWLRWVIVALAFGFPVWLVFAWYYEITPEGIRRDSEVKPHESFTRHTRRKLDLAIIAALALAVVLLLVDRFVIREEPDRETAPTIPATSIAVLPFADISQGKDQEYFSDGISEELMNMLAKVPQLLVAARTSSFSFKGKDAAIPEIARTLLVAHVLEGSVRRSGDRVRIAVQLIRAADGYSVWSETYDRTLDDIFAIQDEIAGNVVAQLKVTLFGPAPRALTTDPEAYALFLRARAIARQFTPEAFARSNELYRQALAIDPRYVPAWHDLAQNAISEISVGTLSSEEGMASARETAGTALALDPDYASAHGVLGLIAFQADNDLAVAARHFERALALDPSNPNVLANAAWMLNTLGRLEEALVIREELAARDPVNVNALYNLGLDQLNAGRYDDAIASFRTVLNLDAGNGASHCLLGIALLYRGDAAAALAEIEQETVDAIRMVGLPLAYHALGRKDDSDAALAALIAKYEKEAPYNIAHVYAFRGEADAAFEWLDKAVKYGDPGLSDIVTERLFANIRSDPRWVPLLRRVGRAPEQLAEIELRVTLPAQ